MSSASSSAPNTHARPGVSDPTNQLQLAGYKLSKTLGIGSFGKVKREYHSAKVQLYQWPLFFWRALASLALLLTTSGAAVYYRAGHSGDAPRVCQ
jgi:hypothetical protein